MNNTERALVRGLGEKRLKTEHQKSEYKQG